MTTAAREGLDLMAKMLADGTATDPGDAYVKLCKGYPALRQRYVQEQRQARPAPRPAPLDYSQRQALAKQERDFPLTVPPPESPKQEWLAMIERVQELNPGMSYDAASRAAYHQTGGKEAKERYRQQVLFGQR
jgi:hypothetical protein